MGWRRRKDTLNVPLHSRIYFSFLSEWNLFSLSFNKSNTSKQERREVQLWWITGLSSFNIKTVILKLSVVVFSQLMAGCGGFLTVMLRIWGRNKVSKRVSETKWQMDAGVNRDGSGRRRKEAGWSIIQRCIVQWFPGTSVWWVFVCWSWDTANFYC